MCFNRVTGILVTLFLSFTMSARQNIGFGTGIATKKELPLSTIASRVTYIPFLPRPNRVGSYNNKRSG